jgi:hypothetical protein
MKKIFVATLLLGVFNSYTLVAYAACIAPAPVDCSVLSASQCQQQTVLYQTEASTYNSCIAVDETCQVPTPPAPYDCGELRDCDPTPQSTAAYKTALTQYNLCVANTSCNSFLPDHATQGYENSSGQCAYNCASGYYLTVSNTCVATAIVTAPVTQPAPVIIPTIASPTQVVAPAAPVVTQTVVSQAVTPTSLVTRPKSIFATIAQAVTPKAIPVASVISVQATTSATTTVVAPVVVQLTTTQAASKPVSFWGRVSNFLAKLNPLNWF